MNTRKRTIPKLGEMTPEQLALSDLQLFCKWPLGLDLWECQKRWADAVQWAIEDDNVKGLLLLAPADHGKTSRIVIPTLLWLHARNRNDRIILASNKDEFAEQIGRAWARRIERQVELRKRFGLAKGDKWAGAEYTLWRDDWEDKDPSLQCVGVGSEIQSQRADWFVGDDLSTRRNSATQSLREKLASWFFTDARSRLDRAREGKGKFLIFGHRTDPQDIYSQLEGKENWVVVKDKAIISDADRRILAPEAHSYDALCEQRADDPVGFALLYQQESVALGLYVTRSQFDHLKNREMQFHYALEPHVRNSFWKIVMAIDPAFSVSKWARYAVLTLWGYRDPGHRVLLYGLREKTSPETLIEICKAKYRIYEPDEFYIEANQGQSLLIPMLRQAFPHRAASINGIFTLSPKDKNSGIGRLEEEMAALFKMMISTPPCVELPYGNAAAQSFVDHLAEEVCNYPNYKYRDALMSWYIAEKGMGTIKQEERRGFIQDRGVIGGVSHSIRSRWPGMRMHGAPL